MLRETLELRPPPHPDRVVSLNHLGVAIQNRFGQQGDLKDIDEAIGLHRAAVDLCIPAHPHRGTTLGNLGTAIRTRFIGQGNPKDIDEAVNFHREALELHGVTHPHHAGSLNLLAGSLYTRFERRGDPRTSMRQLNCTGQHWPFALHFILIDTSLLSIILPSHFTRGSPTRETWAMLTNLSIFKDRLWPSAITPHPERGTALNNLAAAIQARFEIRGNSTDIDEAVELGRQALELHKTPHPDHAMALDMLAGSIQI
ncbi:hypothetical protein DFH06DRAFT_1328117 [Mycena polygramma]|nr:hypothetical protein DFH06DRAFT_1328117 [Mycena polygramma]